MVVRWRSGAIVSAGLANRINQYPRDMDHAIHACLTEKTPGVGASRHGV
jgi:hypothetical protein